MKTTPGKFHYETPTSCILPVYIGLSVMSGGAGTLEQWDEEDID